MVKKGVVILFSVLLVLHCNNLFDSCQLLLVKMVMVYRGQPVGLLTWVLSFISIHFSQTFIHSFTSFFILSSSPSTSFVIHFFTSFVIHFFTSFVIHFFTSFLRLSFSSSLHFSFNFSIFSHYFMYLFFLS